jgi:hypothetical protein
MPDIKNPRIALSQIASLEQALDQAPARNTSEVGKGEAIGILAPKLHALRAKGYAWRDIATWLTEHGVTVTAAALQRYLREVKIVAAKRDKGRATGQRSSASRDGSPATASAPAASGGTSTVAQQQGPRSSPQAAPGQVSARTLDRPSFVPRRDADKI